MLAQSETGSTNEHKAALKLLRSMVLKGRLITRDAMFCQRDLCRHITDSGGDYLFLVKDNQPSLSRTIESNFNLGLSPTASAFTKNSLISIAKSTKGMAVSRYGCCKRALG